MTAKGAGKNPIPVLGSRRTKGSSDEEAESGSEGTGKLTWPESPTRSKVVALPEYSPLGSERRTDTPSKPVKEVSLTRNKPKVKTPRVEPVPKQITPTKLRDNGKGERSDEDEEADDESEDGEGVQRGQKGRSATSKPRSPLGKGLSVGKHVSPRKKRQVNREDEEGEAASVASVGKSTKRRKQTNE